MLEWRHFLVGQGKFPLVSSHRTRRNSGYGKLQALLRFPKEIVLSANVLPQKLPRVFASVSRKIAYENLHGYCSFRRNNSKTQKESIFPLLDRTFV